MIALEEGVAKASNVQCSMSAFCILHFSFISLNDPCVSFKRNQKLWLLPVQAHGLDEGYVPTTCFTTPSKSGIFVKSEDAILFTETY